MAAIDAVIRLQDKMSKQLDRIEKASRNTQNAFKIVNIQVETMDKKMNQASKSSGSFLKSMIAFSGISKIFGILGSHLGDAIKRFDTLSNYTNVMSGLGFDSEESEASINRLKNGLSGLPTTLDDAVQSVQRFAAVNENLKASTEMTLALNDALAAGGLPAEQQALALEQISQAYAKGKFEADEYKSMMNAMPAQLKQVAESLGYTSTALGGDFYNALQKGKISMNQLMKKFVELDHAQEGFHDQALKSTAGINTAFINLKTAVTKGLASILEQINSSLLDSGLPSIAQMINNIGSTVTKVFTMISEKIGSLLTFLKPTIDFLKQAFSVDTFITNLSNLANAFMPILELLQQAYNWIQINILPAISQLGNYIQLINNYLISGITVALQTVYNYAYAIYSFIVENWNVISQVIIGVGIALAFVVGVYIIYNAMIAINAIGEAILNGLRAVATVLNTQLTISQISLNAAMSAFPGILLAGLIMIVIAALLYLWETNDDASYWILYAWDGLVLGLKMAALGIKTAWYGLQTGIDFICVAILGIIEKMVNDAIDKINILINALNVIPGVEIETIGRATFAQAALTNALDKAANRGEELLNDAKNLEMEAIARNTNRQERVNSRTKLSDIKNAIKDAASGIGDAVKDAQKDNNNQDDVDLSMFDSLANAAKNAAGGGKGGAGKALKDVTGTDKAGAPAIQTTTNDDLLSDEDIQLLLDVATRDYKLNYQQITPEFTLTFGDIRETVDVDRMLDQVADRLEAIYNGNLRVGAI